MQLRLLLICGLLWLCGIQFSYAQPPAMDADAADRSWHPQYDLFQLLLEEQGLKTVRSIPAILSAPTSSVLIVASEDGDLSRIRADEMRQFVEDGGAVVLMLELNSGSNFSYELRGLGTFWGSEYVTSDSPRDFYEHYSDCLKVTDIRDTQDLFPGVKTIITNRGNWFAPYLGGRWQWQTIAAYPNSTKPIRSRKQALLAVGQSTTVSTAAPTDSAGIFIVMADSSLLTNGMLWHGDNAKLALRIGELLKRQERKQLLFIHKGRLLSAATERLADQMRKERDNLNAATNLPMPEPSLERMLRLGNAIAKEVVDSNVLNEALAKQPRNVSPYQYFRFLLGLIIVIAVLWILWKLITSQTLRELWLARRRMRRAYEIVSGNDAGDYRTAAGYLAREFCVQWTGSTHSKEWQQALALLLVRCPNIAPEDKRQLTRVVDIASRGCHEQMPGPNFQHFGRTIANLRSYIAVTV